jgi:hypothetical protein
MRLEAELRLSENAVREVVQQTENFSFAYVKELFVSATMHWMSTNLGPQAARLQNGGLAQPSPMSDELSTSANDSGSFSSGASVAPLIAASMDEIILDQVARLRAQMPALASSSPSPAPSGALAGALASARRFLQLFGVR